MHVAQEEVHHWEGLQQKPATQLHTLTHTLIHMLTCSKLTESHISSINSGAYTLKYWETLVKEQGTCWRACVWIPPHSGAGWINRPSAARVGWGGGGKGRGGVGWGIGREWGGVGEESRR